MYNNTQAAATAGNNLKFLMVFYLLFAFELLLQLGSEGMVQIIQCRIEVSYDQFENYFGFSLFEFSRETL